MYAETLNIVDVLRSWTDCRKLTERLLAFPHKKGREVKLHPGDVIEAELKEEEHAGSGETV
jgi:hypothetical protein